MSLSAVGSNSNQTPAARVFITVEGGIVTAVHSTLPAIDVVIVDLDDLECEASAGAEGKSYRRLLLAERDAAIANY